MKKNEEQPHETWILKNGNKPLDLRTLPRCRAKAKSSGNRCKNPAMKGKRVCYLHGGKSPGAPKGNKNAFKHGQFSRSALFERQLVRSLINQTNELLADTKNFGFK